MSRVVDWPAELQLSPAHSTQAKEALVVCHQLVDGKSYALSVPPPGGTLGLADPDASPALTLTRSISDDRSFYLDAAWSALHRTMFRVDTTDEPGDMFLLGPRFGPPPLTLFRPAMARPITVHLVPLDLGDLRASYVFDGIGRLDPWSGEDSTGLDVRVVAPYGRILSWLHDPEELAGHILADGYEVSGDLFALSYLEGWISSGDGPSESTTTREVLVRYMRSVDRIRAAMGVSPQSA